jgi:phosphohistidine swiveling domain-containing protein
MSKTADRLEFAAPGPGGWVRLADHFPAALTAEYQQIYTATAPVGMADYMARYGVLAKGIDVGFVHGHLYITPVPLAGPREMKRTPPTAVVWAMARLHPAFRRRTRAARWALTERPWRAAATHWFDVERPQWQQRNQQLEDSEPAIMATDTLVEHLRACRRVVVDGYRRHFELHGDDLLPIGLLIARCAEWGVAPGVSTEALRGAPPSSTETVEPAWQLLTGYDLDCLARSELSPGARPRPDQACSPLDLRPFVPRQHHDELNELIADAQASVPLREDNGVMTGAWPMGLLRRAMLECGRRLELSTAARAVEATIDELISRLQGESAPSTADLERRRHDRRMNSLLDAPRSLGPDFAIPPLTALPRALGLMGAAQLASADHMLGEGRAVGVGDFAHVGRALLVDDPGHALELIEPGDVVVTRFTCPSWNAVLGCAGALVTTTGGLLSHAAILARELGIPAVLGDSTATTRLTTGMTITVDPTNARVSVSD